MKLDEDAQIDVFDSPVSPSTSATRLPAESAWSRRNGFEGTELL